ncbi:DUF1932 domain-containing protein [Hominifimenecus sp. rT4P-3]|uniref:DUF1932 domain-containing protein n=1 Tax=Hominifimenecus sp. rT4P-3 TaxID=3242979 RepID=UPI003DA5363F
MNRKQNEIAFLGFGEAGFHIARGLMEDGLTNITAYDVMQDDPVRGGLIRQRAESIGLTLSATMEEACCTSRFIFSLTTAKVAVAVAEQVMPMLEAGQVYVDLNSVAPSVLEAIDQIPRKKGVLLCDGAVLGNVQKNGHRVSVYLCGDGAEQFYQAFLPYHMQLKVLDKPVGAASGIKMLKSVYSKGLQQLVMEFLLASESYGVLEEMVTSIHNPMAGKTLEEYANEAMPRMIVHAARRAEEVRNAAETVLGLHLDAGMTLAAQKKFEKVAALHLLEKYPDIGTMNYKEVTKLVLEERNAH